MPSIGINGAIGFVGCTSALPSISAVIHNKILPNPIYNSAKLFDCATKYPLKPAQALASVMPTMNTYDVEIPYRLKNNGFIPKTAHAEPNCV